MDHVALFIAAGEGKESGLSWEAVAAVITALVGIFTWRQSIAQRREDLRFNQAKHGAELLDAIFDEDAAGAALEMADGADSFTHWDEDDVTIQWADIVQALTLHPGGGKPTLPDAADAGTRRREAYIRWCFDGLFYYFERLEHSIVIKAVDFEDVRAGLAYYLDQMFADKDVFAAYCAFIKFHRGVAFMERFPEWRQAGRPAPASNRAGAASPNSPKP